MLENRLRIMYHWGVVTSGNVVFGGLHESEGEAQIEREQLIKQEKTMPYGNSELRENPAENYELELLRSKNVAKLESAEVRYVEPNEGIVFFGQGKRTVHGQTDGYNHIVTLEQLPL